MGFKHGLTHWGKHSPKRMSGLICLFLTVSCALPNPVINQAPFSSSQPKATTSTPISSIKEPNDITPIPASDLTPLPSLTPQATPEVGNSNPNELVDKITHYELDVSLTISNTHFRSQNRSPTSTTPPTP